MAGLPASILLDADAFIHLLEWGRLSKACDAANGRLYVFEAVACQVKGYKHRGSGPWRRFNWAALAADSKPRLVTIHALDEKQYEEYLQHVEKLKGAHVGERETFALAWVLGFDVCSNDVEAREFFHKNRPKTVRSAHMSVMDLLRRLGLAK